MTEPASPYATQSPEQLAQLFGTSLTGLSSAEAQQRLETGGANEIGGQRATSPVVLLARQFENPLVLILLFAAVVSAVAREWTDAVVVLVIMLGSGLLGFFQEWRATRAVEQLRARIALRANVWRDGSVRSLPGRELVRGDVIELGAGSLIPADAVLIEARDCLASEAVLTGETFPAEKAVGVSAPGVPLSARRNCLFMGTSLRSGKARALVIATGPDTEFGKIAGRLRLRPAATDFELGIRHFGNLVGRVMLLLVGMVFAVDVIAHKPSIDSLLFAISIAVGMAPEMLPAVVTITLSRGARAMAARGVIVRRLPAIENLGSMDVLCTDKTGTLTEGVVQLDGALDTQGAPSSETLRLALLNASLQTGFDNPLDEAVVRAAQAAGVVVTGERKLDEAPYDFVRKRLGVAVLRGDGTRTLIVKGALKNVLEVCTHVRNGQAQALDDARMQAVRAAAEAQAAQGFRVLGVATRVLPERETYDKSDEIEMCFEGSLLFFDPPKSEVAQAITDLSRLGVELKIITGDSKAVALHLAEAIKLPVRGVLASEEISKLSDEALWHAAERTTVFAEVDPNQKERLILALRKTGHVVGYMGDGINDASALHAADVGISVEGAVDVAKESADFVLLRRDLDVLRAGIEEGRVTFSNTLKYIYTTTSANFGNMLSLAGASTFLPFLPLLAKQVLLNNFLSDIPAMTIANDGVDPELIARPRRWDMRSIRNFMLVFGAISSVFDYLTFGLLYLVLQLAPAGFRTGWFVESLLTELCIVFVVRTRRRMWRSRPATALWVSSLVVTVVGFALPYSPLATLFGFVPLPLPTLAALVAIVLTYTLVSELGKSWFFAAHRRRAAPRRSQRRADQNVAPPS